LEKLINYPKINFLGDTMKFIDPVKASPDNYKLLMENKEVKVLEMSLKAGEKDNEHSHGAETVYFIKGGKVKIYVKGNEPMEAEIPDGHVLWHEAWTHTVENIGTTDIKAIVFEPK